MADQDLFKPTCFTDLVKYDWDSMINKADIVINSNIYRHCIHIDGEQVGEVEGSGCMICYNYFTGKVTMLIVTYPSGYNPPTKKIDGFTFTRNKEKDPTDGSMYIEDCYVTKKLSDDLEEEYNNSKK